MLLGFSLYFNSGLEKNCELIKRFSKAGFTKAFTSLHIPEESQTRSEERRGGKECRSRW